jgi:site-specific recombinase XerD
MSEKRRRLRGEGHLYKQRGSRVWWAQFYVRGKRHRRSTGETSEAKARKVLRAWLTDAERGRLVPAKASRLTVHEALDNLTTDYRNNGRRSLGRAKGALAHLREFFGSGMKAIDVTTGVLRQYVAERLQDGAANATVNYELALLRRALRLLAQDGLLPSVPAFPMLAVNNARKGFIELGDLRALVTHLPADVAAAVEFAFYTGWRLRSEVLPLTWDRVDFHQGVVVLYDSKNRRGRTFPFSAVPGLREVLERQAEKRRQLGGRPQTVFFREYRPGSRMRRSTVGRALDYKTYVLPAWRDACSEAGLDGLILHDLRRSAVRNLERAGVPRSIAMQLTGHLTENVYRRYDIVDEQDLREGAAKLAAYFQPIEQPIVAEES